MLISDTQHKILALLARFKFLVISQMLPLLSKSAGYTRQQLARLAALGFIKSHQLSKTYKAEAMYFLTEEGKQLILQHSKMFEGDIKLVVGVPLFVNDFVHRRNTISLTIAIYYHVTKQEIAVIDFFSYFDKQGDNRKSGNLEAKTKIPIGNGFFIPDWIMLTEKDGNKSMYFIEMYCGNSSTRVIEQMHKHIIAIAEGTPAAKFGIKANPFVLSCFEHDGIKNRVIEKLRTNKTFKPFAHLFLFSTLQDVQKDDSAWRTINNDPLVFT